LIPNNIVLSQRYPVISNREVDAMSFRGAEEDSSFHSEQALKS